MSLDLEYFKGPKRTWAEGWRPDGFFDLTLLDRNIIEARVKAQRLSWDDAKRLVERAINSTKHLAP